MPSRKEHLEALLLDEPNDPFLRYGLAMEHISAGDDETAVRCFADLATVAPDYVPGYLQAGQALSRLSRPTEARAVLTRGIEVAQRMNDTHAAGEMEMLRDNLD